MSRRLFVAIVLGAAVASASACTNMSKVPDGDLQVVTYEGRDLLCRVTDLSGSEHAYECNFALFWGDPASRFPDLDRIDEDALVENTMPYRGGTLHCLVYDAGHQHTGSTCDDVRWWNETKPSTPAVQPS